MQNTGDTSAFRATTVECEACDGLADKIDEYYSNGGYAVTDGWTLTSIKLLGRRGRVRDYRIEVSSAPTEYSESDDSEPQRLEGGNTAQRVALRPQQDTWVVVEIAHLAS
jgi:hypothetical protein